MIKVEFEIFGGLKRKTKSNRVKLTVPENTTVNDVVIKHLGYTPDETKFLSYVIHEKPVKKNTILKDGDKVKILLLIGGGKQA